MPPSHCASACWQRPNASSDHQQSVAPATPTIGATPLWDARQCAPAWGSLLRVSRARLHLGELQPSPKPRLVRTTAREVAPHDLEPELGAGGFASKHVPVLHVVQCPLSASTRVVCRVPVGRRRRRVHPEGGKAGARASGVCGGTLATLVPRIRYSSRRRARCCFCAAPRLASTWSSLTDWPNCWTNCPSSSVALPTRSVRSRSARKSL